VGATLCFTLFINTVSPHGGKIGKPIHTCFLRFKDRGYSARLQHSDGHKGNAVHKCSHDDGKKEIHTEKLLQDDLEDLYTGPEIQTFFVFAQYFTSLWCLMFFSSGMPALYFVGCLNFFILYWVYKTLLIKHYQITTSFNQDMPNFSIVFYKWAVVLHLVMGLWMYTNSDILSVQNIKIIDWVTKLVLNFFPESIEIRANFILNRFANHVGILYLLFILFVLLVYVLSIFGKLIFRCFYFFLCHVVVCGAMENENQKKEEAAIKIEQMLHSGVDSTSMDIYKDLKLGALKMFYERCCRELEEVKKMDPTKFITEASKNHMGHHEFLKKKMTKRKQHLEEAIL
jgi:hypothetical protein